MSWPQRSVTAATVATVTVLLVTGGLAVASQSASRLGLAALAVLLAGTAGAAAALVARRRPHNVLGPLLSLQGLIAALAVFSVVGHTLDRLPGDAYLTAASQGVWVLPYVAVAALLLVFPDGRLETPGSRRVLIAVLACAAIFMVVAATAPGPYLPPDESSPHVFGTIPAAVADILTFVSLPGLLVTLVALVVVLRGRYRAADARRRQQFKWLALVGWLLPLTLLAGWASYLLFGQADVVLLIGFGTTYLAVPAVVAIAVLRPELFDVERVLSSTVVHAAMTSVLLAVFTVVNVVAGELVADRAQVISVAVTAACAVVLAPLRRRVQQRLDRWLYPARKAAQVAIDQLHRDVVAGRTGPEQLESVLREALHDPGFRVVYLHHGSGPHADDQRPGTPVRLGEDVIGELRAGPRVTPDLLRDIATRAAPLIELVALRAELREALREVEASRARLLRVEYDERARLERDLHDGAQQRLVSLGMALRLAQRHLSRGGVDISGVLDEAVAQLGTAVSELRQLAHGIRPSCLDDGLGPALSSLARSTAVPVSVQVVPVVLSDDLETTAYYVAVEGVANATKHARARRISLDVGVREQRVYVRVGDDGVGGAVARDGSGLAGLADRVAAHGGTLTITSPPAGGTTIEAVLPCA